MSRSGALAAGRSDTPRWATFAARSAVSSQAVASRASSPCTGYGSRPSTRTAALAEWCQGFLYGLGAGAITDASGWPGEAGEIVRDFAEITRAGVDAQQGEESNESAYAELVEFVRVGVQLLFEDLAAARRPPAPAAAPLH